MSAVHNDHFLIKLYLSKTEYSRISVRLRKGSATRLQVLPMVDISSRIRKGGFSSIYTSIRTLSRAAIITFHRYRRDCVIIFLSFRRPIVSFCLSFSAFHSRLLHYLPASFQFLSLNILFFTLHNCQSLN